MITALLIAAAAVALACPLHMLWRLGRSRAASCAPIADEASSLAARQRDLAAQVSRAAERLDADQGAPR